MVGETISHHKIIEKIGPQSHGSSKRESGVAPLVLCKNKEGPDPS